MKRNRQASAVRTCVEGAAKADDACGRPALPHADPRAGRVAVRAHAVRPATIGQRTVIARSELRRVLLIDSKQLAGRALVLPTAVSSISPCKPLRHRANRTPAAAGRAR